MPSWIRSIVAAFSGPVWLRTGSARAANTSGSTGVGPGIMSSGDVVMSNPCCHTGHATGELARAPPDAVDAATGSVR